MILGRSTRPKEASFDLTPMIDVVLLLIIFFMLSSQFRQTQLRPVDLPRQPGDGQPDWTSASVVLDMDRDGRLTILGVGVQPEELPALVRDAADAGDPARRASLIVRADRQCPASHLNRLADRLAQLGIREWKLATTPMGAAPAGGERPGGGA